MRPFSRRLVRLRQCALYSWRTVSFFFFFSSRRRHTRLQGDWSQTCALPIFVLAESGWRVRLFEQRPFLGGRATSYVLPDGEHVDNCQHVTLGCCTNLDDFYRRVGSADKIKFFDCLFFLDPQGRRGEMQAGMFPAPFHMTGSFAAFAPLTLWDKISIARAMLDILRTKGKSANLEENGGISMLQWLRRRGQTQDAIERFWRVVLVSALDEELDRTDARFGVEVFWKSFLSNRKGYRMGVAAVPP